MAQNSSLNLRFTESAGNDVHYRELKNNLLTQGNLAVDLDVPTNKVTSE